MRRFIRYLYEYEGGHRVRNVGFVKVEEWETSVTLNIHGKGLGLCEDETLQLYIFYMDENVCRGIWQGELVHVNPALNYRLIFTKEDTGRPENFARIEGIILEMSGERKFAAVWNDMEVDVNGMRLWDEEDQTENEEWEAQEAEDQEIEESQPEETECQVEAIEVSADEMLHQIEEQECQTEMPEEQIVEEAGEQEVDSYISPTTPQFQKIVRGDIAKLPRCEWRLANNSFLIHGFRNYHHLVFLDDAEGFWLGVPGIYHQREARAAEAFGFPRFVRVEEEEIEWQEEETDGAEPFGYWCRKVRRGVG